VIIHARKRCAAQTALTAIFAAWIVSITGVSYAGPSFAGSLLKPATTAGPSPQGQSVTANRAFGRPAEFQVEISNGYRRDDLDWNIAGNSDGKNPNILSELTWDDIEIYQLRLQGSLLLPGILYARGYAGYGWILNGDNQDSDYDGDNRSLEYSRSNNNTQDDDVRDLSGGIGYPFRLGGQTAIRLCPLVGYSYHEQNLRITDGFQTIATAGRTPPLGPIKGLDSTYDTRWHGPWVGIDLLFQSPIDNRWIERLEIGGTIEYHWLDYTADAKWNLRSDLSQSKSFQHEADGQGIVLGAVGRLFFTPHWALQVDAAYLNWSTDKGRDTVFRADGSRVKTQLNEVNWKSFSVMVGVTLRL